MKKEQAANVVSAGKPFDGTVSTHPAFGVVVLSHPHGGHQVMFGSELRHNEAMKLTVHKAELHRGLSYGRVLPREVLCEVEFTLSQWAQFVASQGMGSGTPCTLQYYRDGDMLDPPRIAAPENHLSKFDREMQEQVEARLTGIQTALEVAMGLVDSGGGKKALREAIAIAQRHASQLPGSVSFINKQFAESMEDIAEKAKTEVEGFVAAMAMRTGIKALQDAAPRIELLPPPEPCVPSPQDAAKWK